MTQREQLKAAILEWVTEEATNSDGNSPKDVLVEFLMEENVNMWQDCKSYELAEMLADWAREGVPGYKAATLDEVLEEACDMFETLAEFNEFRADAQADMSTLMERRIDRALDQVLEVETVTKINDPLVTLAKNVEASISDKPLVVEVPMIAADGSKAIGVDCCDRLFESVDEAEAHEAEHLKDPKIAAQVEKLY